MATNTVATGTKRNGTLRNFIEAQQLFFVATAAPDGRVNVSPKGLDSLRILSDTRIARLALVAAGTKPPHICAKTRA